MGTARAAVVHKHFRLDAAKLKRAQKLLNAPTETETVERALDLAIVEEDFHSLPAQHSLLAEHPLLAQHTFAERALA